MTDRDHDANSYGHSHCQPRHIDGSPLAVGGSHGSKDQVEGQQSLH